MLKAIVFDMDGVIVDSEPLHYEAFVQVARLHGADFDYAQYLKRYVGFDDEQGFHAILTDAGARGAGGDAALIQRLKQQKAEVFESVVSNGIRALPGAMTLIEQATTQIPLALATGATGQDARLILQGLSIADRFDPVVTADDVVRSKPDPATYALAVQGLAQRHPGLSIEPADCLAIEDTPAGVASAQGAGLKTLAVCTTTTGDHLNQANRVIDHLNGVTLEQLRAWFDAG